MGAFFPYAYYMYMMIQKEKNKPQKENISFIISATAAAGIIWISVPWGAIDVPCTTQEGTDLCPKEFTARLWGTEHLEVPCWHCLVPPCFKTALISFGSCHTLPSAPIGVLPSCLEPRSRNGPWKAHRKGFLCLCERCQHSSSFSTDSTMTTERHFQISSAGS